MTLKEAKSILVRYNNNGYPTIGEFQEISDEEFNKWVNIWPPEYLEAMMIFGESLGYKEDSGLRRGGIITVLTVWGERVQKAREVVAYKKTTEGKQDVLRTIAPTMDSVEKKSASRKERMKEIKAAYEKAVAEKKMSKKQIKLNAKRIEMIEVLERNISTDGYLGDELKTSIKVYNNSVEELPTNEQAAASVMRDKKKNKVLSLLLSWITMPFFVIVKAINYILDSAALTYHHCGDIASLLGGKHPALSRIEIPLMMTIFYIAVTEHNIEKDSITLFVELSEKTGIEFSNMAVTFLVVLFFVILIRNIGGIVPFYVGWFYGQVVEKASKKFSTASENDYQMRDVSENMDYVNFVKARIQGRENLIEALMEAVRTNAPYNEVDGCMKDRDFKVKTLKKENKLVENWKKTEQLVLERQQKKLADQK